MNEPTSEPLNEMRPQPRWPRLWILLAGAAGLLAVWLAMPTQPILRKSGARHPGVGKKLPALSLRPLTFAGDVVALDDVEGQVVVLNFWGTWCPPCQKELPHVAELARHYADSDRCRVLAVSCGDGRSGPDPTSSLPELQIETAQLLDATRIALPVYADPDARTRRAVQQTVGFDGYPTTLVLDSQGVVRGVWTGYGPGDETEVAELVESLLRPTG